MCRTGRVRRPGDLLQAFRVYDALADEDCLNAVDFAYSYTAESAHSNVTSF